MLKKRVVKDNNKGKRAETPLCVNRLRNRKKLIDKWYLVVYIGVWVCEEKRRKGTKKKLKSLISAG